MSEHDGPLVPDGPRLQELLGSIAAVQGVVGEENRLGLPSADRWVVVLLDGLGWHNLRGSRSHAPYLSELLDGSAVLTVSVPSTTTTSLTSLGTGVCSGQHGMAGYSFRLPNAKGAVLNPLSWLLPHAPQTVQPVPTVFERIADRVACTTVSLARFAESGLTGSALRGTDFHGLTDENDRDARIDAVRDAALRAERTLVYTYGRTLDMFGHSEGWESRRWRDQLRWVDRGMRMIRDGVPDDVRIVLTGDHGMVDVPRHRRVVAEQHPDLMAGLDCLAGEPRFRHLYVDSDDPRAVAGRWADRLGDDAWVRTRDDAIDDGWFGPVDDRVRERFGHVVVAMRSDAAVMTRAVPQEMGLVGMHGSLTPTEMHVPLIVL